MRGPDHLAELVRRAGVRDARVLDAIRSIPRADFVPAGHRRDAYRDRPIPIPRGQVTTQPSLSAAMIEALDPRDDDQALEIGSGHGFQTALLASLCRRVWTVERFADLAETARQNLSSVDNVTVVVGDGTLGLPDHAPYDVILVSAAFERVPDPLVDQLADGGRLVQPIGPGGAEVVTLFRKEGSVLREVRHVSPARFVRLFGRHGFPPG